MSKPQQGKKRLVSEAEYADHIVRKVILKLGFALCLMGGVGIVCLIIGGTPQQLSAQVIIVGTLMGWLLIREAVVFGKMTAEMEEVLPPTRQNIEQLPAEETLVRASSEPEIEQGKILLRAAMGGEETPSEQLLRASQKE